MLLPFKHSLKLILSLPTIAFLLIVTSLPLYAQIPVYPLGCSNLGVTVEPISTPACGADECNRYYFQVGLITSSFNPIGNPASFRLRYDELSFTLQMLTDPSGGLSAINVSQTAGCLPYLFEDFPLGFDVNNKVTFHVEGDCDGSGNCTPYITFTRAGNDPPYTTDLFVIAVDAVPGENLEFDVVQSLYTCTALSLYCDDDMFPYADPFTVTAPMATEPHVCLEFEDYDPDTDLLPVMAVNAFGSSIEAEYLAFTAVIDADNIMEKPQLLNFVQPPYKHSVDPISGTDDWRVFVWFEASSGITVPGSGDIKLFDIEIKGPVNESLGASAEVCFTQGQMRRAGGTCRVACLDTGCAEIGFDGEEPCDPDYFTVVVSADDNVGSCDELGAKVQLNWYGLSSVLDFDRIRIAVEFDLPSGVSISGIGENTFGCPSNPSCNPSGGFNDCFKIDGNRVTFCFFPITPEEVVLESYFTVLFDAPENCVNGATVRESLVDLDGEAPCVALTSVTPGDFPRCTPMLAGWVKNTDGAYIDDVNVTISRVTPDAGCPPLSIWPDNSSWSWCPCDVSTYHVEPQVRNTDSDGWLNGVTTYDLVLISKHLLFPDSLGFTTIYQYAAADADGNNRVQKADIFELRQLILGIIEATSVNKSWRYFDEDDSGSLPSLPPSSLFTAPIEYINDNPSNPSLNFVAVKVGDMNNSHNPNLEMRPAGEASLVALLPNGRQPAGSLVSLPLRYEGAAPLSAAQFALRFDPARWEYVGVTSADVEQVWEGCFNLRKASEGEVRFAWFTALPEERAQPGQAFFRLLLRAKQAAVAGADILRLEGASMPCSMYDPEGRRYAVRMAGRTLDRQEADMGGSCPLSVTCAPNPGAGATSLTIRGEATGGKALLTVFDAFGHRMLRRELNLPPGSATEVAVPEATDWPAGPYAWRVKAGGQIAEGLFLKQ